MIEHACKTKDDYQERRKREMEETKANESA